MKTMANFMCLCMMLASMSAVAGDLPEWLEGWKAKGDLRLRFEAKEFNDDTEGRDRARYRFRLGAEKKLSDKLEVSFRFASGKAEPTSTNDSFDSSFSGKDWNLDQVQMSYTTGDWTLVGGKMKNILHSSDIVWDTDVNPEGFFQNYTKGSFYANFGELFVEESTGEDLNLYLGQAGVQGGSDVKFDVSASYYTYNVTEGLLDYGSDNYDFIDIYATAKFKAVEVGLDYVKNLSDKTIALGEDDTAYAVFVDFGGKKPGDWNGSLKYAKIERFSSYTALADSDFGGGDKKGFVARAGYAASKILSWQLSIFSVESIVAVDKGYDMGQLDCSVKF